MLCPEMPDTLTSDSHWDLNTCSLREYLGLRTHRLRIYYESGTTYIFDTIVDTDETAVVDTDETAGGLHFIDTFRKEFLLGCVELKLNNKINL